MNSVPFLVAMSNFETAVELALSDPTINNNREIVAHYINLFDLPFDSTINRVTQLHHHILNNLFSAAVPVSLQLKYYNEKYSMPTALMIAAIYGRTDFIENSGYKHDQISIFSSLLIALLILGGHKEPTNHAHLYKTALKTLDQLGLIHLVQDPKNCKDFPYPDYVHYLIKNWLWDKLFKEVPKDYFESEFNRKGICGSILHSKRPGVLLSPPEELKRIPNWQSDELLSSLKRTKFGQRLPFFMLHLQTKEHVDFFRKEILDVNFTVINKIYLEHFSNCEVIEAIEELFGAKFEVPEASTILYFRDKNLSVEEEVKFALKLGYEEEKYLIDRIANLSTSDTECDRFLEFANHYLKVKYSKDKIQRSLDMYYNEFPEKKRL